MSTKEEIEKILEDLILDVTTDTVTSFEPYVRRIRELYNDVDTLPLEQRREAFIESVRPYLEEYDKTILNGFTKYWLEKSPKGRKFRFEKEKVFDIAKRLKTWARNQRSWSIVGQLKKKS